MVYHHGKLWYAECVDLDLTVARPTAAAAVDELARQIESYITAVITERLPLSLLNRPAPWTHQLQWALYAARVGLSRLFHRHFAIPRPVHLEYPQPVHA